MTDALIHLFGPWLLPDWHSIWLLVFWATLSLFAWIETVAPATASAATRERRWPTNIALGVIAMFIAPLAPVSGLIGARWAEANGWGALNLIELPLWLAFVATLLLRSLVGYVFHFAGHKVHALWRLHRVHHCDDYFDVSTAVRVHPIEFAALVLILAPLAMLFGFNPWALIVYEIAEGAFGAFSHANIRLPDWLDRSLRYVFVTPNMHVIHHSTWQPETDSNYGQVFSFWDRLFGTYSDAPRAGYAGMQIGLDEMRGERAADFWLQMKSPAWRSLEQ